MKLFYETFFEKNVGAQFSVEKDEIELWLTLNQIELLQVEREVI